VWAEGGRTDVRFGSKVDIEAPSSDVRFTSESGHWATRYRGFKNRWDW